MDEVEQSEGEQAQECCPHADGAVRRARDTEEIRAAASRGPLLIVTRRRHERVLRDAGIPLYVWLDTRRHLLYATVPVS